MAVDRLQRVNSLLKRVVAENMFSIMQGDTVQPGLITVTEVSCGKDLRDATVKVSVFGDDALKETALQHLRHNARRFQAAVNREVRMKFTPRLTFQLETNSALYESHQNNSPNNALQFLVFPCSFSA